MVITKSDDTEKIRARKDDAAVWRRDAHQFGDKSLGFFHMFQYVQSANCGKMAVGKGTVPSIVHLALRAELARPGYVGFGHINAVSVPSAACQSADNLPGPAADIQHPRTGWCGSQIVGVFRVKIGVPICEKFRVSL